MASADRPLLARPEGRPREAWLDTARGVAILLVVCFHAAVTAHALGLADGLWVVSMNGLAVLRLPLFFFVSGLLAAGVVQRGWRDVMTRRVLLYGWVYTLWWSLTAGTQSLLPHFREGQTDDAANWARGFAVPENEIWYLWALALFLVVGRLTRRVPAVVVVGGAAAVAVLVAADLLGTRSWVFNFMALYLWVFLLGVRFAGPVRRTTTRWRPRGGSAAAAAAVVVATVGVVAAFEVLTVPFVRLTATVVTVAAGVVFCIWASHVPLLAFLAAAGRRTLPLYVLHQIVMDAVALLSAPVLPQSPVVLAIFPLALAAVVVLTCLWAETRLARWPWLFAVPRRFVRPSPGPRPDVTPGNGHTPGPASGRDVT